MNNSFFSTALNISSTPLCIHPSVDFILDSAANIAKSLGFFENIFYKGQHTMSLYSFSKAMPERVVDATVWFGSLYYLDDFFGEDIKHDTPPNLNILLECWLKGTYNETTNCEKLNNLYRAIAYCGKQIRANSPDFFFEEYTQSLLNHLKHSLHPVDYQSVEEYIESRVHFGGMYPMIKMIEYTENLYLTDKIYSTFPLLKKLELDCVLIGALSNDIISYHKEKHSRYNLLNAYIETGLADSIEISIKLSIAKVNEIYHSFLEKRGLILENLNQLDSIEKNTINTYINGLSNIISASYHWQLSTDRYRSEENVFTDLRYNVEENMALFV